MWINILFNYLTGCVSDIKIKLKIDTFFLTFNLQSPVNISHGKGNFA